MDPIQELVEQWEKVREGTIKEFELVPEDKLDFRATPETRSIIELLHHIVETERVLVRELCREEANLMRRPFAEHVSEHAANVKDTKSKPDLISLLRGSLQESSRVISDFGQERLAQTTKSFDGKTVTKLSFLSFVMSHEMYHRGQLTVFQRLLGIEPGLTRFFKEVMKKKG